MSRAADNPAEDSIPDPEQLAREIAAIVDDKQGEEIVIVKVGELVSYTDYLVIATARNERLVKAIHDQVRVELKARHRLIASRAEGLPEGRWVLVDYLDCILHLFVPEARQLYRLEQLWGEVPRLDLDGIVDPVG